MTPIKAEVLKAVPVLVLGLALALTVTGFGVRQLYFSKASAVSITRGFSGDFVADKIIGKPDFSEVVPNTVAPNKLFEPRTVIVDRSSTPNHLYIYDGGNSRILGIKDVTKCVTDGKNCSANPSNGDIVFGQPNFTTSACNGDSSFQTYPNQIPATASTLCFMPQTQLSVAERGDASSMYISPTGDLYVTDSDNHRVLKYISPFTTDVVADEVWGQNDFSGNLCNKGGPVDATTLCFGWSGNNNFTAGVEVDNAGNLWVADSNNNRVLRFAPGSKSANLVLGQADFNSNSPGNGLNQLHSPAAVRVNSQGWVYVADHDNGRVLRFKNPSTGGSGELFSTVAYADGLEWDPTQPGKIWVASKTDAAFYLYDENTQQSTRTLGRVGDQNLLNNAVGSFGIDSSGNYYVGISNGDYMGEILYFQNSGPYDTPVKILFDGQGNYNLLDGKGITAGSSVVVAGNQLVVLDFENRILFWNDPSTIFNGKSADGILEVPTFDTKINTGNYSDIKASNKYLYVSRRPSYNKPLRIERYALPLSNNEQPEINYLSYPFNVLGGGQLSNNFTDSPFWGLEPAPDDSYLWISHADTNRVFRVRNPFTNPLVDVILGQNNGNDVSCNRGDPNISGATANSLCNPGKIGVDRLGNLYVSDDSLEARGNFRLMIYDRTLFPTNNSSLISAPNATYIKSNLGVWQPAFDSNNHMVIGFNPYFSANPLGGRFPAIFNNPLSNSSTPDNFLSDYGSMGVAATFDANDNLYVGDQNRSRVLIYNHPFPIPKPSPTSCVVPPAGCVSPPLNCVYTGATCTSCGTLLCSTPPASPLPNYIQYLPDTNTVGFWHLDTGSGAVATDASSKFNNGSLIGNPLWNSSANSLYGNSSLQFDGTNRYVSIPGSTSLNFGKPSDTFTIDAWIKTKSGVAIVSKGRASGSSNIALNFFVRPTTTPGVVGFSRWCQGCPDTPNAVYGKKLVNDGLWHHVAFVNESASSHKLYVDGNLDVRDTSTWTLTDYNTDPVFIGKYLNATYGVFYFSGSIDEVRISNVARSATEIFQTYQYSSAHGRPL